MATLTKRKAPATLAAPYVKPNSQKPTKTTIDETRTSVSGTEALQASRNQTIEDVSDVDSDEDHSDGNEEEENETAAQQQQQNDSMEEEHQKAQLNGEHLSSTLAEKTQLDKEGGGEEEEEPTSPSFGELLRGTTEPIDLTVMLRQPTSAAAAANDAAIRTKRTAIVPLTHQSLATVLSQALSTDDADLLESCLNTTDTTTIKNTIERIDSSLAGILLHKLAARLHKRPGRAGTLMTWVQWTLIAHGGALASQAKAVASMSSLQKVLAERAKGLGSLLALKGKLDILEGQMQLRRRMRKSRDQGNLGSEDEDAEQDFNDDDEEDEDALYVEGEERHASLTNGLLSRRNPIDDADESLLANGFTNDSDDDEEEDSDDTAALESDADDDTEALDGDDVNFDDVDESMGEDEDSDVETAPPAKLQKVTKSFSKKK